MTQGPEPRLEVPARPPSLWRCLPLPETEPDPHPECDAAAWRAASGYHLVAARARGKKHKHNGAHCDDYFCCHVAGPWTIAAVADGAGSARFSRVGARAACSAAVEHLKTMLAGRSLEARQQWTSDSFRRDADQDFCDPELRELQAAVCGAVDRASDAVADAATARQGNPAYAALLGREIAAADLSCTLLLAIQSTVSWNGQEFSLVLGCQIGDGLIVAIEEKEGQTQVLGAADGGEFAGETLFLTSSRRPRGSQLGARVMPFFNRLQALILATDGVADDYFPSQSQAPLLYADLLLNGAVPWSADPGAIGEATALRPAIETALQPVERLLAPDRAEPVTLASGAALAQALGMDLPALLRSKELLAATQELAARSPALAPEQALLRWLDSYQVRGSFDDRTLAMLCREVKA